MLLDFIFCLAAIHNQGRRPPLSADAPGTSPDSAAVQIAPQSSITKLDDRDFPLYKGMRSAAAT